VIDLSKAVFLSYASQDAEAAEGLCNTLRAAGIEVWFDQSELRGGDAWDASIRRQIKSCALFIPLISRHTHDRDEGYFRLEWKLAVDRCHLMAADKAFLLPVVIDDTPKNDERVPDRFREVQWTRLRGGDTSPAFVERVRRLLGAEPTSVPGRTGPSRVGVPAAAEARKSVSPLWRSKFVFVVGIALAVVALGYFAASRHVPSKRLGEVATPSTPPAQLASTMTFDPPQHSIAVLPFVNISGDKAQGFFSDGLTEELLNSLTEINELQVAARSSSFSFQGEHPDISTIARKLNVATILEGSVRRSAHTVRITAQLINAVTGFHLWSKTYDRDLGDVLKLQTEIATEVAGALRVTLLGDISAKIELGGTHNPAAFDAYLHGAKAYSWRHEAKDLQTAISAYTEAIRLDPRYALAFAARSLAGTLYSSEEATGTAIRPGFDEASADARRALELAPDLAQAHLAFGYVSELGNFDFTKAAAAYERALVLAPGNAQVLRRSGFYSVLMGHFEAGLAATRRAVVLDPLTAESHFTLGAALYFARRYEESVTALTEVISLDPDYGLAYASRGLAYYWLGDLKHARESCESKPDYWFSHQCLAVIYGKLGRQADADAELAKLKGLTGDASAYQYATIFAQWGNKLQALKWLETAQQLRDPGLEFVKTDALLDPLRNEPRFQKVMRELRFPN
jgi:TolB-like protein/Flp pilus assembly protein TadD